MTESKAKLFTDFSPTTKEKWIEKIREELKGKDPKKLVWKTKGGVSVDPFYVKEDIKNLDYLDSYPGNFPFTRGIDSEGYIWNIRQDIFVDNVKAANKLSVSAINNGVESIGLLFKNARDYGQEEMVELFKNLAIDKYEINFEANKGSTNLLKNLKDYVRKTYKKPDNINGSLGFDPLKNLNLNGKFCKSKKYTFDKSDELIRMSEDFKNFRIISINARDFHNSGSTISQVLGFALAQANEYLSELTNRNLSIDRVSNKIKFNFAVGSNYFMEIAKFRAARYLWANIVNEYHPVSKNSAKMLIHAETSLFNKTLFDQNVNMLRSTTESMSAILGNVNSLTVFPYDKSFKEDSNFSNRIARNIQILLREESFFDKVVDPAAGSYYIEKMTDEIIKDAWKIFLDIENRGGYIQCFLDNYIQDSISLVAQQRDMNISQRKEILVGTNQFPNQNEISEDKDRPEVIVTNDLEINNLDAQPLTLYRGAEAFEELRLRTERAGVKTPKVFLFPFGKPAMSKIRATFSSNFFACAGFEIVDKFGFDTMEDGVKECIKSEANIVVLCSSDEEYEETAIQLYDKLKDKAIVVIAGYPKEIIDKLKSAGLKNFIHMRSNVLEILNELQEEMGIE